MRAHADYPFTEMNREEVKTLQKMITFLHANYESQSEERKEPLYRISELVKLSSFFVLGVAWDELGYEEMKILGILDQYRTETMQNFVSEINDSSNVVVHYELDGNNGSKLVERAASFCLHIGERQFTPEQRNVALTRAALILKYRTEEYLKTDEYEHMMLELVHAAFEKYNLGPKVVLESLLDQWILISRLGLRLQSIYGEAPKDFMANLGAKKSTRHKFRAQLEEIFGEGALEFDPLIKPKEVQAQLVRLKKDNRTRSVFEESDLSEKFEMHISGQLKELLSRSRITRNQAFMIFGIIDSGVVDTEFIIADEVYLLKSIEIIEAIFHDDIPHITKKRTPTQTKETQAFVDDIPNDVVTALKNFDDVRLSILPFESDVYSPERVDSIRGKIAALPSLE